MTEPTYTIEDVQDQLFPVYDILHSWPKSLKNPKHYQRIAYLFQPHTFWTFANPWEVTICVHRETLNCEYLVPEHQCLLLGQYIEDTYGIVLPSLPKSFNLELWSGNWDLSLKQVNSEAEFAVYVRLAKSAKTAKKLERAAAIRSRELELARETVLEAQTHGAKFVCIDIECYEFDHRCTTEIGIASLLVPGGQIQTRHLLVREYADLRNGRYVPDMSHAFGHGTSEWIALRDCKKAIAAAFRGEGRRVFFIGHDPMADISYLEKNHGFVMPRGMVVFDTRLMYSAYGGDAVLRNLAHCLDKLEIEYWNLHNAGNDAYYTLAAFMKMCLPGPRRTETEMRDFSKLMIRDIVPDDLLVAQEESFRPAAAAKGNGKVDCSEFHGGRSEDKEEISRVFEKRGKRRGKRTQRTNKSQPDESVGEELGDAHGGKDTIVYRTGLIQLRILPPVDKGKKPGKGNVDTGKPRKVNEVSGGAVA